MTWRSAGFWLALIALAAFAVLRQPDTRPETAATASAVVTRVVDGDTVHVELDGHDQTVRYIGMDTPESVKPGVPVQCFAERASAANSRLIARQPVTLRFDAERRDRYGRLLAYVYRKNDGLFVNAALVRGGYARTLTIAPNTRHERDLATLQSAAQGARRGLWRSCPGA